VIKVNHSLSLINVDQIAQKRMMNLLNGLRPAAKREYPKYSKFEKAVVPFLLFKPKLSKLEHLSLESFRSLPLNKMNQCYWKEIDEVIDWVRCTVFELIRARLVGALDCKNDHVICAMQFAPVDRNLRLGCLLPVYADHGL
jgi:hypothetical protein